MINRLLAALLSIVFAFAMIGCGTPRGGGGDKKRQWGTTQTGTNIPRWTTGSAAGSKQRTSKPKREKRQAKAEKSEKPKREQQDRRKRPATEEVITRGGFR